MRSEPKLPQPLQFLSRTPSADQADQETLAAILAKTTEEINAGERKPHPLLDFVGLSENLADAIVKAAESNFSLAEIGLKQAREYAEEVRHKIHAKNQEIQEMTERLKEFSSTLIDAHDKFLGKVTTHDPRPIPPTRREAPRNRISDETDDV